MLCPREMKNDVDLIGLPNYVRSTTALKNAFNADTTTFFPR